MNKKYIAINALILCVGLGIILGLTYEKKNTKSEQKENNTNEYTEKIDELEKSIEEKNTKIKDETSNTKEETIEELKELLEKADFRDNEYQDIVNKVMNTYYTYKSNKCGEHSESSEYRDGYTYYELYTFHNLDEIKSYLKKFLSEKYINNYNIIENYEEKNNKLYCRLSGKGSLIYEPEGTQFKIISSTESKIEVYCIEKVYQLDKLTQIQEHVTLIKENGNWVVDEVNYIY